METEILAFVMDIARKPAEPAAAEPRPENRANGRDEEAEDDHKFAELGHGLYTSQTVDRLNEICASELI